jgi:hypothetical protein
MDDAVEHRGAVARREVLLQRKVLVRREGRVGGGVAHEHEVRMQRRRERRFSRAAQGR